ncbi:MAG: SGNH/GDSL hydrolase family protein [Clostridia bacterium]|nr:SGNH/GDSL hydrolase family protein [Clostridia bacterium]
MELQGKSVIFVGDSLCEAACEWNDPTYGETVGWAGRIMAEKGMSVLNKSKGGASMSLCRGENTVINQLIAATGNNFDYCIIEGGCNDAWDSIPVGAMTESLDSPFDLNTFAGGLENTFKYAKENFKGATFGYILTFRMPASQFGRMSDMSEYFALSKKICDKWEIPYLDLYFDDNLNKYLLKGHTTECLPDTVHPNSKGYNILTPYIANWMETL